MNISDRYRLSCIEVFQTFGSHHNNIDVDRADIYRSLTLDMTKDRIELPIAALRSFADFLKYPSYQSIDTALILLNLGSAKIFSTPLKALQTGFVATINSLIKANVQGKTYYLGRGLILDSLVRPILIYTVDIDFEINDRSAVVLNPKVYINSGIFENSREPLEKHIISKLLPALATSEVWLPQRGTYIIPNTPRQKIDIIITDIRGYFKKSPKPKNISTIDEDLNQTIVSNIDFILDESR